MRDQIQFDPALKEILLRRTGDPLGEAAEKAAHEDEIPVVARLNDPQKPVNGLKIVSRLGEIVTGRVALDKIILVRQDDNVASLKASLTFRPHLAVSVPNIKATPDDLRPINASGLTGRGIIVGIIDWGLDFAHADFRHPDGRTRLLYLWDQRGGPGASSPEPYGYGREFTREQIDQALTTADPYAALDYDPAQMDRRAQGMHGTHVCAIAAGNGRAPDSSPGVAPEADIIFVHLRGDDTQPEDTLGDSVRLLEAVHYISQRAGDQQVVINLSLGRTGGSKLGLSPVERALDAIIAEQPGCVVVMSTGNYYDARLHASGRLETGTSFELVWQVPPRDDEYAEMEIWYDGGDAFSVVLVDPFGRVLGRAALGETQVIRHEDKVIASIYNRESDPNTKQNQINLFLWPQAVVGEWRVILHGDRVQDGRFHAWIERDQPPTQSRFSSSQADPRSTIGTICTGFKTISVGAYDARIPGDPLVSFSSSGPTPDNRSVPIISAPGASIIAAKSTTMDILGRRSSNEVTTKHGTSMAAPHVTGVVALLMQEAGPKKLTAERVRQLLVDTARPPQSLMPDAQFRYGAGMVDAAEAVLAVRKLLAEEAAVVEENSLIESGKDRLQIVIEGVEQSNIIGEKNGHKELVMNEPNLGKIELETSPAAVESSTVLSRMLVHFGDAELSRLTGSGTPAYESTQPLYEAPLRRIVRNSATEAERSTNFVLNTAYRLGVRVPQRAADGLFPSGAEIYDALLGISLNDIPGIENFQVVAWPEQQLSLEIRTGDLLLQENGRMSIISSPILTPGQESDSEGWHSNGVHVLEAGAEIHPLDGAAWRPLADQEGRILPDRLVLRIRESAVDMARLARLQELPDYRELWSLKDYPSETYSPQGGRTYTPSADPTFFRCAPTPPGVVSATQLPQTAADGAQVVETVLTRLGVSANDLRRFRRNG
ncbi:MAG: S8 family peptidase, partial [Candidatus Promineifilaceae bacterium]|nr:S8 family peptidase [Candidatus Promineifilaceae bacterium]